MDDRRTDFSARGGGFQRRRGDDPGAGRGPGDGRGPGEDPELGRGRGDDPGAGRAGRSGGHSGRGVGGWQAALGGRLVRLRTAAGLEATELADAAGVDRASYRSMEAGDAARLTYLDLLAIADALAVPAAAVLADPE